MCADIIRAVDLSEWTGEISQQAWQRMRDDHNVQAAIIQCWGGGSRGGRENVHFFHQVDAARAAGLTRIATYCWPPSDWQRALDYIGDYKQRLAFFALDVETGARVAREHVEGVRARGIEPVIYTGPGAWGDIMGRSTEFRDCKVWLARYPRKLKPSEPIEWRDDFSRAFGNYRTGGWTTETLIGWQFRGTTDIAGEQADLNVFDASVFARVRGPILVEEEDMPIKIVKGTTKWTYATNGLQKWLIPNQTVLHQLQNAGILEKTLIEMPDDAVNAIPTIK